MLINNGKCFWAIVGIRRVSKYCQLHCLNYGAPQNGFCYIQANKLAHAQCWLNQLYEKSYILWIHVWLLFVFCYTNLGCWTTEWLIYMLRLNHFKLWCVQSRDNWRCIHGGKFLEKCVLPSSNGDIFIKFPAIIISISVVTEALVNRKTPIISRKVYIGLIKSSPFISFVLSRLVGYQSGTANNTLVK